MISARILAIPIMCAGLGASILHAGDFSTYRGLQFGMTLPEAAKQAGTKLADARTVHQRPAVIQELDWQPRPPVLADPVKADPVRDGLLIKKGTLLPAPLELGNDSAGWACVAHNGDLRQLEKALAATGGTFFYMAARSGGLRSGLRHQTAMNAALRSLVADV